MSHNLSYSLGFYETTKNGLVFNEIITSSLEEIIEFTKGFSSQDELLEFLEEDTSNMYSKVTILDNKNKCKCIPLYENSRNDYDEIISKNIMDIFINNPGISHNIDEINELSDIEFIKYLAIYPELIAVDGSSSKVNKKGK